MRYDIIIIEDEPLVAQRLERLTREILADSLGQLSVAGSVSGANDLLSSQDFDLILLDLFLAGEDGFDLLKKYTAKAAHTIVVSAQVERAIEAYEFGVLDFVPKPFTKERLSKALERLWVKPEDVPAATRFISIETRQGIEVIELHDVLFFKGLDKYSEVYLKDGESKFYGKPLNSLEHILSRDFVRVHKSYLVFRDAILKLRSLEGSRYALNLTNGSELPVGRTRVAQVRRLLESFAS